MLCPQCLGDRQIILRGYESSIGYYEQRSDCPMCFGAGVVDCDHGSERELPAKKNGAIASPESFRKVGAL